MGYTGETFVIPCNRGGMMHNPNLDIMPPVAMIHPTRNLNLNENGRARRGGTAHVNASAFTGTPQVMGVYDFTLRNGNQFIMSGTKDGKLYKDSSTTIKTGMSTSTWFSFATFDNTLYITDGNTTPQTWDGAAASTSNVGTLPSDWSGSNFPQQFIVHGRGASERLWALGCPSTPHTVYACKDNDASDFGDTNGLTIRIDTNDGYGVVGGAEFGDRLIVFGKKRPYIIDDSDSDSTKWGYEGAQWEGGTINFRTLVRTPNDLVSMTEDGEIYSVVAAESYGDYKKASLTRPAFMDEWIKEHVRLSYAEHFHGVYDPVLRAIKFFVVRNGQTTIDTALVYFIDRPPEEAWMIHGNWTNNSGYSASASALIRVSTGSWKIYTGDYGGNIWKLEEANANDNSKAFWAGFRTPRIPNENSRVRKNYKRIFTTAQPQGDYDLTLRWWVDETEQTNKTVSLDSNGAVLGSFTLGTDTLGGEELIDADNRLGSNGKRIQFELYNNSVDEDFFIGQLMLDFRWLGGEPD